LTAQTQQDFDRLGRLATLAYLSESPKLTPDVRFAYDAAGNRTTMTEDDGPVRCAKRTTATMPRDG